MKGFKKSRKRGAMEMSVTTIVVLVVSLAMLGVGMFLVNKLRHNISGLPSVDAMMEKQIREELAQSTDKLKIELPKSEVKQSGVIKGYYGLRNVKSGKGTFNINIECIDAIGTADPKKINFEHYKSVNLEKGKIAVQAFYIKPDQDAALTEYHCMINVTEEDSSEYAKQDFYITVTG